MYSSIVYVHSMPASCFILCFKEGFVLAHSSEEDSLLWGEGTVDHWSHCIQSQEAEMLVFFMPVLIDRNNGLNYWKQFKFTWKWIQQFKYSHRIPTETWTPPRDKHVTFETPVYRGFCVWWLQASLRGLRVSPTDGGTSVTVTANIYFMLTRIHALH